MRFYTGSLFLFLAAILLISGCSSSERNPIESYEPEQDYILPEIPSDYSDTDRNILGIWKITFNPQTLSAEITPERSLAAHYNVRSMIPPPEITVNSYDPLAWVIDVDIAITNPYNISAYDVRGIIFTDDEYHMLLNPDAWTPLFDIPGGYPINPFKAYAKSEPRRKFAAQAQHSENYIIYLPNGNLNVIWAVDASFPTNCEEPYLMKDFKHDPLYAAMGSSARATVYVYDWQNNVNEVSLYCPQVTGPGFVFFTPTLANQWATNLTNTIGAPIGEYTAWLISKSSNSGTLALYDRVKLTISPGDAGIPQDPQVEGTLHFFSGCKDVVADGEYAYIADSKSGFKIVDISDPLSPVLVSCVYPTELSSHRAYGIKIEGNLAYIANFRGGLQIIDISDKTNPQVLSELNTGWYVNNVFIDGNYAYTSEGLEGFKIIDISDPYNPVIVASGTAPYYYINSAAVENNIAYFMDSVGKLVVYDVSNPNNPIFLVEKDCGPISHDILVINGLMYVAQVDNLLILDVSDPQNPTVVSNTAITGWSNRLMIVDQLAYIATDSGLTIVDISDPATPVVKSEFSTTERCEGVSVFDGLAYLAKSSGGLKIIDISDPENPIHVSSFGLVISAYRVNVMGDYCFVACSGGMGVLNISDPEKPLVAGMYFKEGVGDIEIAGTQAYLPISFQVDQYLYSSCFDIVDIHNPSHPTRISTNHTGMSSDYITIRMKVSGNYAYVTCNTTLQIWDVSNPQAPQKISTLTYSGNRLQEIELLGDYAYIASDNGIYIVDVRDPSNPVKMATFGNNTSNLTLYSNYLISAKSGISIYDISNQLDPKLVSSFPTGALYFHDMSTTDGFIYFTSYENDLKIIDIRDPANPVLFKDLNSLKSAYGVAISGRYAYVAYASYCFKVIRLW